MTEPTWAMEKVREAFHSVKAFCDDINIQKALARALLAERIKCATIGRVTCGITRHVTLGDKVYDNIMEGSLDAAMGSARNNSQPDTVDSGSIVSSPPPPKGSTPNQNTSGQPLSAAREKAFIAYRSNMSDELKKAADEFVFQLKREYIGAAVPVEDSTYELYLDVNNHGTKVARIKFIRMD